MATDDEFIGQLLEAFRGEMGERVQEITDCLLALEKTASAADQQKVFEALFRGAHSLKGAAQSVDLGDIAEIAHHLESLFGKLKRGEAVPSRSLIDLSLEALDRMQECMAAADAQTVPAFALSELLQRLARSASDTAEPKAVAELSGPEAATGRATELPVETAAESVEQASVPSTPQQDATTNEYIRVSLDKLDAVVRQVENLQVTKNEIAEHLETLQKLRDSVHGLVRSWQEKPQRLAKTANDGLFLQSHGLEANNHAIQSLEKEVSDLYYRMRSTAHDFDNIAGTLRDDSQMIRLIPVSTLLRPLSRTVRNIADEMGKSVEFVTVGDNIELDRRVLDSLRDPLTHLIRNACDHGIEAPEHRSKLGKAESGQISVEVSRSGSRVTLLVKDDGAGIDVDKIAEIGVQRRIISAEDVESKSSSELLSLIFSPGFSSKQIITSISGRGVGLDVVQENLRRIGGSVSVQTSQGEGTTFILLLPVALLSDRGLLVRAGGATFAIPSTAIDRLTRVEPDEFVEVAGSQMVVFQGRPVPVAVLSDVLELAHEDKGLETGTIAFLSKGRETVGLIVEEVLGEREMVVKPFSAPLLSVQNVAGATLLAGGQVIPVLNPSDLVDSARHRGARVGFLGRESSSSEGLVRQRILVVDDSITTRMLEKTILETNGYDVTVALDGREGWELVQEQRFDLVVSDIEMPVMNGFELTKRIKASASLAQVPVVLVTSLSNDSDKRKGIEVGADAYIVKGQFETKVLLDIVTQLL